MPKQLRIVLAQINLTVGDIQNNLKKLIDAAKKARDDLKAQVIVFPELSITGYLHDELVFHKAFITDALDALDQFKQEIHGIYCVIGHPQPVPGGLHNACSLVYNGQILGTYSKQNLPNYGVFDEHRYYLPGNTACVVPIEGIPVGITICEDLWYDAPIQRAAKLGARIILSPNASPFEISKHEQRQLTLAKRATTVNLPIIYVNHLCGQDELVFDGGSMVVDQHGAICGHAGFFTETLMPFDITISDDEIIVPKFPISISSQEERVYKALVLGVKDYIQKNKFKGALIGVSGGIDSALTLAIAVDALGADNVKAIFMPSRYTATISRDDAMTLIVNLKVDHEIISIENPFIAFLDLLGLKSTDGITVENLQSRCRGVILMALSNKTGRIVLTTGNRSELAVGYATLYGDMAGGLAVLSDITKTWVYRLARYRNQIQSIIPERIIQRPPTAELAPNQKDEDMIPPYAILDPILELYLNEELSIDDIISEGFDRDTVIKVVNLIKKSEYKRRQLPVGIRINHHAFGRDRRYPITNLWLG